MAQSGGKVGRRGRSRKLEGNSREKGDQEARGPFLSWAPFQKGCLGSYNLFEMFCGCEWYEDNYQNTLEDIR